MVLIDPRTWVIAEDMEINGRRVAKGTELSIKGERGRFRFLRLVVTCKGSTWIDVYGGKSGHETIRSFHPSKVKTVHRISRLRAGVLR